MPKLGQKEKAIDEYRKGLKFVAPSFRDRSIPFTGENWGEGAAIELSRRDATAALGDATPTDSGSGNEKQPAANHERA